MKYPIIFLAFLFSFCAQLKSQNTDSLIQYEPHAIELKTTSMQNSGGCFFECISKKLQRGDELMICYESAAYTTAASVKDPAGRTVDLKNCTASALPHSSFDFAITITEPGNYEFFFTSEKPHEKGNANIDFFLANDKKIRIDPLWTTCRKLSFLLGMSRTNFEFIETEPNLNHPETGKVMYCNLFLEAPAVIEGLNTTGQKIYKVVYGRELELETSKIIMKEVDQQLQKCLSDDWVIEKTELANDELEHITYTKKDGTATSRNQTPVQYKMCLKTTRSGKDTYDIIFEMH